MAREFSHGTEELKRLPGYPSTRCTLTFRRYLEVKPIHLVSRLGGIALGADDCQFHVGYAHPRRLTLDTSLIAASEFPPRWKKLLSRQTAFMSS